MILDTNNNQAASFFWWSETNNSLSLMTFLTSSTLFRNKLTFQNWGQDFKSCSHITLHQATYNNPLVLHDVKDGEAFFRISTQHPFNEFFGIIANIGPLWVRKCILPSANSLFHARRYCMPMITVEWRESTKPASKVIMIIFLFLL